MFFEHLFLKKSHIFKWPVSQTLRQNIIVFFIFYHIDWKNLPFRVPGHRWLAISRLRVPNFDGFVPTATGNLLSIGAPRHWSDPEIARSQKTNQQKQREKNRENLTCPSARSASITVDTQNVCFWISYISIFRGYTHLKKVTLSSGWSHRTLSDRNMIDLVIFRTYWLKTTYVLECPVTVDSQTNVLESFTFLYFSRMYSSQKSYLLESMFSPGTETWTRLFLFIF